MTRLYLAAVDSFPRCRLIATNYERQSRQLRFLTFFASTPLYGETIAPHHDLASPLPHKQSPSAVLRGVSSRAADRGGKNSSSDYTNEQKLHAWKDKKMHLERYVLLGAMTMSICACGGAA